MHSEEQLRTMLEGAATRLAAQWSSPIDLEGICARLGISLERSDVPRGRALLVKKGATFRIKLPQSDSSQLSRLERFLVAHELGHVVISRDVGVAPFGKSEYWQHEELCDSFARHLLLPNSVVVPRI